MDDTVGYCNCDRCMPLISYYDLQRYPKKMVMELVGKIIVRIHFILFVCFVYLAFGVWLVGWSCYEVW